MLLDFKIGSLVEPVSGRQWDRPGVLRQVAARIRRFQSEGMSVGDRVFIHYGNRLEFFADLLSIWHLGACVVPVDARLTEFEIEKLARLATPRFSFVDDKTDASILTLMSSLGAKVINALDTTTDIEKMIPPGHVGLDNDALILFTSGSTGSPKGVVHTHRSLRARWSALRENLGLEPYGRTLCLLPTHFGHGLICNCLFPWLSGQDLFITPPFDPNLMMRLGTLVDEHKITCMSSVPSLWGLVLKVAQPPRQRTLRRVHCGSAPLSAHLWKEIQSWAATGEVFNTYGITETGSWVAGTTIGDFVPEDGLIGKPWGAAIRILKTSDRESLGLFDGECKPGEAGYVWIKAPALMKGYFERADLTEQAVCEGWFIPGDIGLFDERGIFYLKGREREEINKGGTKIYPADIDAVIERFDRARDVVTFGIDDPLYGQEVAIAVTLEDNSHGTIRSLYQWTKRHLAKHKIPARWYLVDSIPRTSRGKINRNEVRDQCLRLSPLDLRKILQVSEEGPR
jgi:oxalate---CoA ligase